MKLTPEIVVTQVMVDRFNAKVERGDGCWLWLGKKRDGYGRVFVDGPRYVSATHMALLVFRGEYVPEGLRVCHRCDNPPCVNPDHLFIGTQADNILDMTAKGRGVPPPPNATKNRARGERSGMSKLTEEAVIEIRRSREPSSVLAKRFNVNHSTVSAARRGVTWRHVA